MTETKEQMIDLMATIQLPEEGIRQLLDAREQLEKEGHWDVIVQTAEQVMTADGELSVLTKTLEETEGRDRGKRRNIWCQPLSSRRTDAVLLLGRSESAV